MTDPIAYLNPTKLRTSVSAKISPSLLVGRKYRLLGENPPVDMPGICGGQKFSADIGAILPRQNTAAHQDAFLWDGDSLSGCSAVSALTAEGECLALGGNTPVANNRFVLSAATVTKPEILNPGNGPQLSLQAGFDFVYTADAMNARLGVLTLVEAQCFVVVNSGERHELRNSGDEQKLLYLTAEGQQDIVNPLADVSRGHDTLSQNHTENVSHAIPEQVEGSAMETMTVLEQYQTFFLQRELPFSEENIWTPVCAPISWGWSIRIARRHDDEWGIARQKLLMPTVGHDGMEMPEWQGNTRDG